MAFTLDFYQNGSTRINFLDGVNFSIVHWRPGLVEVKEGLVEDDMEMNIFASSNDILAQKLELLNKVLYDAEYNREMEKSGNQYTPIFLRANLPNGSYVVQSEVFGSKIENLDQLIETPILGNELTSVKFKILRRPYFEDSTLTQLITAQTITNNLEQVSLPAVDTDEPSPLLIRVTPGVNDQDDQMLVALIAPQTATQDITKHIFRLEADNSGVSGYTVTLGVDTAAYTQATFSNGKGAEVTPTDTANVRRVRFELDGSNSLPVADQIHNVHLFLRCYELSGSNSGYLFRARKGYKYGTKIAWGPYGADQKSVVAATYGALVPFIDCGVLNGPKIGSALGTNFTIVIDIEGVALNAASPKFRVDAAYTFPVFEGGKVGSRMTGFCMVTFPDTLDSTNLGALDANDRVPKGYVADSSNNVRAAYGDMIGSPLFLPPNKATGLYVTTKLSSGAQTHARNQSNVIDVWVRKRYRIVKGV